MLCMYGYACLKRHFSLNLKLSQAQEGTYTQIHAQAPLTEEYKDNMVSVSFPFHGHHFYSLKDRFLSHAAEKVHGCLHLKIDIYLCFHGHLFNI